jgi:hypothetical protein
VVAATIIVLDVLVTVLVFVLAARLARHERAHDEPTQAHVQRVRRAYDWQRDQ